LLRAEQNRPGSQYGELISSYIKDGKIVPMDITVALLERAMVEAKSNLFLVDGFPRAMDQALRFEKDIVPGRMVLFFECPEDVMLQRLLKRGETSGRADDNLESIKKRFQTFQEQSLPVVEHYEKLGKVKKILCVDDPDTVYAKVRIHLQELLKGKQ
jgi:UMP-CMP kinase